MLTNTLFENIILNIYIENGNYMMGEIKYGIE